MLEVTFAQLQIWVAGFFWPFVRLTSFMLTSPILGHSAIPNPLKLAIGGVLAIVIGPILPPMPDVPIYSWAGFGIIVEQILIGASIGLIMQVTFAVVQAAGEFIGLQMGLAFATFFSPDSGANTMILSRILHVFAMMMFLALNGHLMMLELLAFSFQELPIGVVGLNFGAFEMLARFGSVVFLSGILLALPVFGALLIINLTLGILNRSAPQLTVFSIGFPMSLTMGLFLLMTLTTNLGSYLQRLFANSLGFVSEFIQALAPLPQ
ncbi:flagellar biosynthetic protein FliR [Aliidiomarina sanyensis]|uniref:Flagellar biosynthetic protein FliR n=1 Tax=Aliidiomarina sanyensis TaxID=1249555 RepID=A0A432WQ35_9GAMM|nr:flagellar biosynthetic protein FliR [Aliidiomarina sanyensis]RUO35829.1 flagellar biosynthetic protein FliR [Aliidiomarina sanyensis]